MQAFLAVDPTCPEGEILQATALSSLSAAKRI